MADGINPDFEDLLQTDDTLTAQRWEEVKQWLEPRYGKETGIESILFLIGIQSRGDGFQPKLKRQVKQDLIMEGTHCVFETLGLYKRVGRDARGHIIWERSNAISRKLSLQEQEKLLRLGILNYFDVVRNSIKAFHQSQ